MKKFWFIASYYLEYLLIPILLLGYIYIGIKQAFEWVTIDIEQHRRKYKQGK